MLVLSSIALYRRYTRAMRFGLIAFSALALPLAASAQMFGGLASGDTAFSMAANSQYPAPNGNATLTFLSSALDLTGATLTVSANNKNIYQGSVQPVAVQLGRAGAVTRVSATITVGGASYTQSLSIQPQDVALVVEPVASAPPLYPGKPLVPIEGDVRVVAMANLKNASGVSLNPTTLSYTWTVENTRVANSSGIGKTSIMVASPLQYRARDVSVAVTSPDGSLVGGATLSLSAFEPSVRIYENDPLLGIRFDRALTGSYAITGTESTLYAAPFSLPTTGGAPLLEWFLNGSSAQRGVSITLRPSGTGQGNASLSLVASVGTYTEATTNLSLSFGAKPGSNFFGL